MKGELQNSNDEAEAILLKILKRQRAYRALNQAAPSLEDDKTMDSLMEQLLDVFDENLRSKHDQP